MIHPFVK